MYSVDLLVPTSTSLSAAKRINFTSDKSILDTQSFITVTTVAKILNSSPSPLFPILPLIAKSIPQVFSALSLSPISSNIISASPAGISAWATQWSSSCLTHLYGYGLSKDSLNAVVVAVFALGPSGCFGLIPTTSPFISSLILALLLILSSSLCSLSFASYPLVSYPALPRTSVRLPVFVSVMFNTIISVSRSNCSL